MEVVVTTVLTCKTTQVEFQTVRQIRGVCLHVRLRFVSGQGTNGTKCVRVWNEWRRCLEIGVNITTEPKCQDQCRKLLHKHSTCRKTESGWIFVHRHNPPKSSKRLPAVDNGRGSANHRLTRNGSITAVRWYDNRAVNLMSSFVGREPLDMVKRYCNR